MLKWDIEAHLIHTRCRNFFPKQFGLGWSPSPSTNLLYINIFITPKKNKLHAWVLLKYIYKWMNDDAYVCMYVCMRKKQNLFSVLKRAQEGKKKTEYKLWVLLEKCKCLINT